MEEHSGSQNDQGTFNIGKGSTEEVLGKFVSRAVFSANGGFAPGDLALSGDIFWFLKQGHTMMPGWW